MVVKVENLLKRFGDLTALDGLSIQIEKGEIFGLLGPNGSGKTTLINSIMSLLKYDKGSVHIFGEPMSPTRTDLKGRIGYIPQEIAVIEELSVYENIDFFCGLYIKDKETRKKYVEEAIDFVGLKEFVKYVPKKLSGGLKRRLNLACGIAHKPELIIFDEPTVAVDPQSRNAILEGIKKLNEAGATIIYTTHYMEEVEALCTRISIIDRGRLLITGDKDELKKSVGLKDRLYLKDVIIEDKDIEAIRKIHGVTKIAKGDKSLTVDIAENLSIAHILTYLENKNIYFSSLNVVSPTLNDVFLEITGKELRDE